MQNDLDVLREFLKGESYNLDANTLLEVCFFNFFFLVVGPCQTFTAAANFFSGVSNFFLLVFTFKNFFCGLQEFSPTGFSLSEFSFDIQ